MQEVYAEWVKPQSRVLDLGCGDGAFLQHLRQSKQVRGLGIDNDLQMLGKCIERGIPVLHQDINQMGAGSGLDIFTDNQFDLVTCVVSLQELAQPVQVLEQMLRIGRECIVVFPNFAHWKIRLYLLWRGLMPVSEQLPHQWHDTPNIHLFTIGDFEKLCREKRIGILHRMVLDDAQRSSPFCRLWPALFGGYACYHLSR